MLLCFQLVFKEMWHHPEQQHSCKMPNEIEQMFPPWILFVRAIWFPAVKMPHFALSPANGNVSMHSFFCGCPMCVHRCCRCAVRVLLIKSWFFDDNNKFFVLNLHKKWSVKNTHTLAQMRCVYWCKRSKYCTWEWENDGKKSARNWIQYDFSRDHSLKKPNWIGIYFIMFSKKR